MLQTNDIHVLPSAPAQSEGSLDGNNNPVKPNFRTAPRLTKNEAREAIAETITEGCCFGPDPLRDITFDSFESSNTYKYVLNTFTETRTSAYTSVPHKGDPIYMTGSPIQPIDYPAVPNLLFKDEIQKIEIPNTAHIENCVKCFGMGTVQCETCHGRGTKPCKVCNETGKTKSHNKYQELNNSIRCSMCSGAGCSICDKCQRAGRTQCDCCNGSGKLKWFLELTVTYKNNTDHYLKRTNLVPEEVINKCKVFRVFTDESVRLQPLNTFTDFDINQASSKLLNTHSIKYNNCRIIGQRHEIFEIPITYCSYWWKDKDHACYICGLENTVYVPPITSKDCSIL